MEQVFDAIADGLADKQYAIVDNFLKEEEVDAILKNKEFINEINKNYPSQVQFYEVGSNPEGIKIKLN